MHGWVYKDSFAPCLVRLAHTVNNLLFDALCASTIIIDLSPSHCATISRDTGRPHTDDIWTDRKGGLLTRQVLLPSCYPISEISEWFGRHQNGRTRQRRTRTKSARIVIHRYQHHHHHANRRERQRSGGGTLPSHVILGHLYDDGPADGLNYKVDLVGSKATQEIAAARLHSIHSGDGASAITRCRTRDGDRPGTTTIDLTGDT